MAKPDWGDLQQRFLSDHVKTGISPKDWCEAQGLNYTSARRYIKKPSAQNAQQPAQNIAQKKVRSAQRKKASQPRPDNVSGENCAEENCAKPSETKPIRGSRNSAPTNPFPQGNQQALKHGGYGRRLLLSDDVTEDAHALTLDDELFWLRAANLTAAANIGRWRTEMEDAIPEAEKALLDKIGAAEKAMHRNTARIESLEYTLASTAKAYADERLKLVAEEKARFEVEQGKLLSPLEVRKRQLANEKAETEIENIRSGKNDGNLIVVHNALQVPGAMQPPHESIEGD